MRPSETTRPDPPNLDSVERFLDELVALRLPGCSDACFAGGLLRAEVTRTAHRVSVSGVGFTPDLARQSCLGEAAEYVSFLRRPEDPLVVDWPDARTEIGPAQQAVVCRDAVSGEPVALPDHLILRNPTLPDAKNRTPSNGLGAGRTLDEAKLHGLLELIERHEVMTWWLLQEKRQRIDDSVIRNALPQTVSQQTAGGRPPPWFLYLTEETEVPVVGAFSQDPADGEVAYGFKAAPNLRSAIRGAFLELRQHELARHIARARGQTQGEFSVADFPCLLSASVRDNLAPTSKASSFEDISLHLHQLEIQVLWADLTRSDVGIPVARVFSHQLQGSSQVSIIPKIGAGREESARIKQRAASLPELY